MAKATGLRKRSQITKANKTMFIWVASMSAVAMICLVIAYHLVHTVIFNAKVIAVKAETIGNLQTSNKNVPELQSQIRALDTNERLMALRANPEDQALQVVLDALPSTNNPLSFGASLQTVLLVGPSGLSIKSITVSDSASGEVTEVSQTTEDEATSDSQDQSDDNTNTEQQNKTALPDIYFSLVVEGPEESLQEALQRLERSIRSVHIKNISILRQGNVNEMSVSGSVFYQLEKTADLKTKVVK